MEFQHRRFATDAFPSELRLGAWCEVLSPLMLKCDTSRYPNTQLNGFGWSGVSSLGSVFSRFTASPQTLTTNPGAARGQHVLVLRVMSGNAGITAGDACTPIAAGDVLLLDPAQDWKIDFQSNFQAIIVALKEVGFLLRLVRTNARSVIRIHAAKGLGTVVFDLLNAIAECLDSVSPEDLAQMEVALEGVLVASLGRDDGADPDEESGTKSSTSTQLAQLRRVCRTIEARLSEADTSLHEIAGIEKLSPRYLQKLFLVAGTTFSEYIRKRRLDRCRADLSNASLKHLTILEICFRWGFTDAANFSRAFLREFHVTPKEYRTLPRCLPKMQLRGRPSSAQADIFLEKSSDAKLLMPALASTDTSLYGLLENDVDDTAQSDAETPLSLTFSPHMDSASPLYQAATGSQKHYYIPASSKTVHWGYFSKSIKPILSVNSGDYLTIETLTQHAYDDYDLMIKGDAGAESVFHWDAEKKGINCRGAGPAISSIYGRGAGEGFGVHICTGPVHVQQAEPGDVLEIRIIDIQSRPSASKEHEGKTFGSNAASWWGFHYNDLLTEPKPREVVTIYEIHETGHEKFAKAVYNFRWTPQTDPAGVRHDTIDYPGIPVDHCTIEKNFGILQKARIPVRPHFGVLAVAPDHEDSVDSIPPSFFGGNLDNWRAAAGSSLFLPVSVAGALFSVGDPHASQGDAELCGTAIECSLTGKFQLIVHKKHNLQGDFLDELNFPFLETPNEWVIQGFSYANHLLELGVNAQSEIYKKASLDMAMRDAFRKTRRYLMSAHKLSEDEAISLMSVAVDFGVTQVVNGNWGVHAIIKKSIFADHL